MRIEKVWLQHLQSNCRCFGRWDKNSKLSRQVEKHIKKKRDRLHKEITLFTRWPTEWDLPIQLLQFFFGHIYSLIPLLEKDSTCSVFIFATFTARRTFQKPTQLSPNLIRGLLCFCLVYCRYREHVVFLSFTSCLSRVYRFLPPWGYAPTLLPEGNGFVSIFPQKWHSLYLQSYCSPPDALWPAHDSPET